MMNWPTVSSTMPHLRFSSLRSVRGSISPYIALLAAGTVFFFFLHYIGNQIPYELAFQRLKEDYTEKLPWMRHNHPASRFYDPFDYCQTSLTVLAGAERNDGDHGVTNAVLLKTIGSPLVWPCTSLGEVLDGGHLPERLEKMRYSWGHKALYAIALRHMSVSDFRVLIEAFIYAAHLLLAGALLLTSRRTFFIVSPVLVFSLLFSNMEHFSDVASGLPHICALLAAGATALLSRFWERAIPMFCFIAGMVSSYLWQYDGHNFLMIALFVLIGWFGNDDLSSWKRLRRAVLFTSLYVTGFLSCMAMMQVMKMLFHEYAAGAGDTFGDFGYEADQYLSGSVWDRTLIYLSRMSADVSSGFTSGWLEFPIIREIRSYWAMGLGDIPSRQVLTWFSGLGLIAAAIFAIFQARHGRLEAAWSMLLLCGLLLVTCVHLFLPHDIEFKQARYVFLPLALCWSCMIMALTHMHRRTTLTAAGAVAVIWMTIFGWHGINAISIDILTRGTQLEISDRFYVYHGPDRLIYVRDDCTSEDVASKFFLHIDPTDANLLPAHRVEHGFDNLDFFYWEHSLPLLSERRLPFLTRCAASIDLPQYGIESIRTGQFNDEGQIWSERFIVQDSIAR